MAKDAVLILYGSQTGQAETIAETIHEATPEHDIESKLLCLHKSEEAFELVATSDTPVIFLCSTTGDGELPANARKFNRMIQRRTLANDHLSNLRYALLGLGDSNYSTFCGGPKKLERSLKKLGARSFYPTGFADDGTDLEIVVEPWIEGLWPALKEHLKSRCKQELRSTPDIMTSRMTENEKSERSTLSKEFQDQVILSPLKDRSEVGKKDGVPVCSVEENSLDIVNMNLTSCLHEVLSDLDTSTTLPPALQPFLKYCLVDAKVETGTSSIPYIPFTLAADDKFHPTSVQSATQLTSDDALKVALCLSLNIPTEFEYQPGDSFGIFVPNPKQEVNWLIQRLKLTSISEKPMQLQIREDTKKKNARVPSFIPPLCTMRYILANCLEIRSVPKRTFLRTLLDHTEAQADRNVLQRLCSKEGLGDYVKYIREPNLNILDILASLPTCQPPFEVLLEHLPRIRPRLYSAASSLETCPVRLRFVFNVINFEAADGRMYARKGLCTGYLYDVAKSMLKRSAGMQSSQVGNHTTKPGLTIFRSKTNTFRLPADINLPPIIMVGPGTGVAPFIGFLEHLRFKKYVMNVPSEAWLFFGCRHEQRDYIFRTELAGFLENGVLSHLVVAFSRDGQSLGEEACKPCPRYVQDNIKIRGKEIRNLLLRQRAVLYVCGDARNMAKDVKEAVTEILSQEISHEDAELTVKKLIQDGRYKEDVWT